MAGQLVSDHVNKLRYVEHPDFGTCVVGYSGSEMIFDTWSATMENEGFTKLDLPENPKIYDGVALLVTFEGEAYEIDTNGLFTRTRYKNAIGSGSDIALHYLTTGFGALRAVREAIKTNVSCGGRIVTWDWRQDKWKTYAS